jgi:hypothetical protein
MITTLLEIGAATTNSTQQLQPLAVMNNTKTKDSSTIKLKKNVLGHGQRCTNVLVRPACIVCVGVHKLLGSREGVQRMHRCVSVTKICCRGAPLVGGAA